MMYCPNLTEQFNLAAGRSVLAVAKLRGSILPILDAAGPKFHTRRPKKRKG